MARQSNRSSSTVARAAPPHAAETSADAAPQPAPEPDSGDEAPDLAREERVRYAAYRRYLERGGAPGGELEDWLAAEAEDEGPRSPADRD